MKETFWNHFKHNHLIISVIYFLGGAISFSWVEPESRAIPLVILILGVVLIPLGSYLTWRKKQWE